MDWRKKFPSIATCIVAIVLREICKFSHVFVLYSSMSYVKFTLLPSCLSCFLLPSWYTLTISRKSMIKYEIFMNRAECEYDNEPTYMDQSHVFRCIVITAGSWSQRPRGHAKMDRCKHLWMVGRLRVVRKNGILRVYRLCISFVCLAPLLLCGCLLPRLIFHRSKHDTWRHQPRIIVQMTTRGVYPTRGVCLTKHTGYQFKPILASWTNAQICILPARASVSRSMRSKDDSKLLISRAIDLSVLSRTPWCREYLVFNWWRFSTRCSIDSRLVIVDPPRTRTSL